MATYTVSDIKNVLHNVPLDSRVRKIILFGSYAKGEAQTNSDIDLYLDSGRQITGFDYFHLKATFEDAFRTEVDLIPDLDIEPNSLIENEIFKYGVTVYEQ